jgi:hypothetical protein
MNTQNLSTFAQQFGSRIKAVKRRTWVILALVMALLFGLAVWAAIAVVSFFWGQTQTLVAGAPELAREATRVAAAQVGVLLPAAQEKLAQMKAQLPSIAGVQLPEVAGLADALPTQDVAGSDLGPARFAGLTRISWLKNDALAQASYQGAVDYAQARQHYIQAFTALGFSHAILGATVSEETHEFVSATERMTLKISQGIALSATERLARSAIGQPLNPIVTVSISAASL